ncbi:MAG: polysaccharide pyruvyl transferase CsaB [Syntrophothermaceae bacterium]|jgi:polysaccharide pyruvyl transferase CsaB
MRVVLSGYYGFDNAGDEALLTAITSSLKKVNPHIDFVVLSANPDRTRATHGLPAVSRVNPLVLIRELRRADLLISGGGSLLQDITGPFSLPYYLGIVFLAQLLGTPVVFYAQGVGPITRKLSKKMIRAVVNRVNLVTLRDQDSQELLLKCGVTRPPIQVTADPVFVLEPGEAELNRADAVLSGMGLRPESNLIGVSVREWEQMNWEPGLARALDNLSARGYQVVIVPLQHTQDIEQSHKLASLMGSRALVVEENLSSLETMALISRFHLLIGMRLHSLIFAACTGIPFIGISYDPKVDHFLRLYNQEPVQVGDDLDDAHLAQAVSAVLDNWQEEVSHVVARTAVLKEKAELTAYLVMEAISSLHSDGKK